MHPALEPSADARHRGDLTQSKTGTRCRFHCCRCNAVASPCPRRTANLEETALGLELLGRAKPPQPRCLPLALRSGGCYGVLGIICGLADSLFSRSHPQLCGLQAPSHFESQSSTPDHFQSICCNLFRGSKTPDAAKPPTCVSQGRPQSQLSTVQSFLGDLFQKCACL